MESKNHPQTPHPLYVFIVLILLACILMAYHVTKYANEKNAKHWQEYKHTRDSLVNDTSEAR